MKCHDVVNFAYLFEWVSAEFVGLTALPVAYQCFQTKVRKHGHPALLNSETGEVHDHCTDSAELVVVAVRATLPVEDHALFVRSQDVSAQFSDQLVAGFFSLLEIVVQWLDSVELQLPHYLEKGKEPSDQLIAKLGRDILASDKECVVFNWECCSDCNDHQFGGISAVVMDFTSFAIEKGWMSMFSDFSLKALIGNWKGS
jgi:hypothetical protein